MEAVPKGATFQVALRFENSTEAELGLIFHIHPNLPESLPKSKFAAQRIMASFHEGNETQKRALPKGELLMTRDEKVELAKRLAENLQIKRSEWQRWVNYLRQCGDLGKALKLAEHLSRSPSIGQVLQRVNERIKSVLSDNINEIRNLTISDLSEIFGYVSWWLEWIDYLTSGGKGKRVR